MSKIKKIMISIVVGIVTVLGLCTTANAYNYNVGDILRVSLEQYLQNSDIYCAQHGQILRSGWQRYKVISRVYIEGNKSTDHTGKTQTSWDNAKLAYILSNNGFSTNKSLNTTTGAVPNAIWNNLSTWMANVGQYHEGLTTGFTTNGNPGNTEYAKDLDKAATEYANKLTGTMQTITDNTKKDKIKVVSYEKDGKSYMRVGPFNWSFTGTMESVTVNDQNGQAISGTLYSSFNGNNEYWYSANELKSGRDFYISVPMNTGVNKITKITGKAKINVKTVNIWFLNHITYERQNLIIREPGENSMDITTAFDYNIVMQGNLKVIKVNKDNETVKLKGVGFNIQYKNTGKYIHQDANGNISYVDKSDATEFITDNNGEILIKNLVVGTYVAYETKNPNYGYQILTEGQEQNVVIDKTAELKIPNKQIYVKLSGYVWVDKIDIGKGSVRDYLFNDSGYNGDDVLFNGVTVRLKDRVTEETVKETVTSKLDRYKDSMNDGNGEYLFEDVLIEKLKDYYIEFEYNGLTYTNVVPHIDKNNGSKAAEGEKAREQFNQDFSVVEGKTRDTGFTRDARGNEKHALSYTISNTRHEATLINDGTQYPITSNTLEGEYSIEANYVAGQEEIRYINLGLYEREQPDIALVKDLQNVRLAVNGYEHTYIYAQRFANAGEYGDGFDLGVKFGNKYGDMSYSRPVYKADYDYINEADKSKELKVYVTYQLTIRNQSSNLTAQINSLLDYYDSKYQIVNIGNSLDQKGNVVGNIAHTETAYNGAYTKSVITNTMRIEAQKEETIYVQFALNREAIINILNDKANLDNVAEINSYSIYDGDKIYAGIDKDSNPGNCVPGEKNTYEDDTDASPALKLVFDEDNKEFKRTMSGKVFLDSTSGELKTREVRQGSGIYEDGEQGIEGVDITLTENTGSGKVYTAKTDANGDFSIAGYIPGDYTLTYTWGDTTYTVQDYKGTVYNTARNQENKNWYKEDIDTRYTDAIDNYATRQQIDAEIANNHITTTQMDSTTPTMGIGVEEETDGNTKYGITSIETEMDGDRFVPKGFAIRNIDFGIVERARQVLDISKDVTGVKITLANGQTVIDAKVVNGKLEGDNIKGLTYMGPSNGNNGLVKAEIDNELIQGANIQIEYTIQVANKSELDYDSEKYYIYGIEEGNKIQIKPEGVYDYLDSQMVLDTNKDNGNWEVVSRNDYDTTYTSPTMIETYFSDGITTEKQDDGTEMNVYKWEVSENSYRNLFTEWATEITEERTVRSAKLDNKTILQNSNLEKELEPGENKSVNLYTSKVLANTDEIDLNNDTEITEIKRVQQTGRIPDVVTSHTYDRGETVTVTPPTGENQNYILPIIIGVTALIVLGAGVIIIKKKVIE